MDELQAKGVGTVNKALVESFKILREVRVCVGLRHFSLFLCFSKHMLPSFCAPEHCGDYSNAMEAKENLLLTDINLLWHCHKAADEHIAWEIATMTMTCLDTVILGTLIYIYTYLLSVWLKVTVKMVSPRQEQNKTSYGCGFRCQTVNRVARLSWENMTPLDKALDSSRTLILLATIYWVKSCI